MRFFEFVNNIILLISRSDKIWAPTPYSLSSNLFECLFLWSNAFKILGAILLFIRTIAPDPFFSISLNALLISSP